ncbi:MAG: hypothetical protein HYX75_21530 [Acidobacteria bacterium]|nr:hypothetical protein [Acidobacteriota bacterium]
MVAGTFIAFSPSLVNASQIGSIDHHFLEPALLLGLMGSVVLLVRAGSSRALLGSAALVATALLACVFVQVALILAAAVAILAILLAGDGVARLHAAASAAFAMPAAAVMAYRLTRPPLYPDDQWHLGYPHFAALLGGAVTCALMAWVSRRGESRGPARGPARGLAILLSVAGGSAAAAAVPGALEAFSSGSGFLGGDPWFSTIVEFRPLFFDPEANAWEDFRVVGGAVFLVGPLFVLATKRRDKDGQVVAVFALAYCFAALSTKRFVIPLAGPLAVVAGVCVAGWLDGGRRRLALAAALLAVGPSLYECGRLLKNPSPVLTRGAGAMLRAAYRLREIDGGRHGRILAPWDWGHLLSFTSASPVIVDGFGTMGGLGVFEGAQSAPFLVREEAFADYCRRNGIRFVVVDNPFLRLPGSANCFGVPSSHYLRPSGEAGGSFVITRLMQVSFWWRAYYDKGRARPERGARGAPFRFFRLVYSDPQMSWAPSPFGGPMVQVWELIRSPEQVEP